MRDIRTAKDLGCLLPYTLLIATSICHSIAVNRHNGYIDGKLSYHVRASLPYWGNAYTHEAHMIWRPFDLRHPARITFHKGLYSSNIGFGLTAYSTNNRFSSIHLSRIFIMQAREICFYGPQFIYGNGPVTG